MSYKVLVVDDESEIADLIEMYLQNENYTVYKSYTAQSALEYIESEKLDLAILDVMLPDIDGFQICKKIREKYTYPVIMLTAKDGEVDTITGLTLGADDYVTKPFKPLALMARVKAQLRRYKKYNSFSEPNGFRREGNNYNNQQWFSYEYKCSCMYSRWYISRINSYRVQNITNSL